MIICRTDKFNPSQKKSSCEKYRYFVTRGIAALKAKPLQTPIDSKISKFASLPAVSPTNKFKTSVFTVIIQLLTPLVNPLYIIIM